MASWGLGEEDPLLLPGEAVHLARMKGQTVMGANRGLCSRHLSSLTARAALKTSSWWMGSGGAGIYTQARPIKAPIPDPLCSPYTSDRLGCQEVGSTPRWTCLCQELVPKTHVGQGTQAVCSSSAHSDQSLILTQSLWAGEEALTCLIP